MKRRFIFARAPRGPYDRGHVSWRQTPAPATIKQPWSVVEEAWKKEFPGLTFAPAEAHKQSVRTRSHTANDKVIEKTSN